MQVEASLRHCTAAAAYASTAAVEDPTVGLAACDLCSLLAR